MEFPVVLTAKLDSQMSGQPICVCIHESGLLTFIGPNGSGKTQLLRALKQPLQNAVSFGKVRYVSAGRLGPLETSRSNFDGHRTTPSYDTANFGSRDYGSRRHLIETGYGDFHTLSARPDLQIKVAERLRTLFRRDVFLEWDAGNLKVNFARVDAGGVPYSSAREASGLLHLVVLLAALYDDEVSALIIDEPEVSLHPQLQSFLLREIRRMAGDPATPTKKLILLATHSTEFIELRRPLDLASIVFCNDVMRGVTQIPIDAGELQSKKIAALLARLGQEHKLALFCSKPLLVEGPSDAIVCSGLDLRNDIYLEAAGSQVLPVIGKGQMPIVSKLMRMIGKMPVILADADAFSDNLELIRSYSEVETANSAAQRAGHQDLSTFSKSVFDSFCQIVERNWGDISSLAELHPYWTSKDSEADELLIKRRAAFCTILSLSDIDLAGLPNSQVWKPLVNRLMVLLDILEEAGCFILRKGTIEDYYQYSSRFSSDGKPFAAVEEVDGILQESVAIVQSNYSDIMRALRFAAATVPISEARAVRELLWSVAAPALGTIGPKTTAAELSNAARRLVGDKATLFNLDVLTGEDGKQMLVVDLETQVLDVKGFPLRLDCNMNLVTEVNRQVTG